MMITNEDLYALKEEYKFYKIIYLSFENTEFVFRSLNRKEYNEIISIVHDEKTLEDVICQTALLYPEDYNISNCPFAGLPPFVSKLIIENTNVNDIDKLMNMYKESKQIIQRFDYQCITLIKAALPEISIEEIQSWSYEKLMFYSALSEKIINLKISDDNKKIDLIIDTEIVKEYSQKQKHLDEDKEFIKSLREQGIDPMFYFDIPINEEKPIIEEPFLGGRHWTNGVVLDAIRQKILQRQRKN